MLKKKSWMLLTLVSAVLISCVMFFCLCNNVVSNNKVASNKVNEKADDEVDKEKDEMDKQKKVVGKIEEESAKAAFNMSKYSVEPKDSNKYLSNSNNSSEEKMVFLTFDDGPNVGVTDGILDILKKNDVKATFFLLGTSIEASDENKQLVKRMVNEGHSLGNHSYSHDYKKLYPNEQTDVDTFISEFDKTNNLINSALGYEYKIRAFRMPNGYMTRKHKGDKKVDVLIDKLKGRDSYSIDWNSLSYDAEAGKRTPKQLVENIKKTAKNKKHLVILMHDTKNETLECLQELIDTLKNKKYTFKVFR
ncbi:Peptidoglycan/xylan/chitin deacetylase, PgdA/CDA1 family [Clostridium cavendishii DSM 21758]|uniref:Peptidoglycan/xylan/chitin deacetylase, PgdA/CDA1 family n=1 Tax=Clostridium cavendishii DSM 21758 TaxID=1121302 RepID=A0A1M6Q7N6_9CLOT|nr:polysaccharide deacetylase family protein [Clostridium cavendishii]SHK16145.1 Peptidoglycan/xylan/chitin deacetylase, PgdA/CDA1 family [Clostridium cavendishii DSM 21758]